MEIILDEAGQAEHVYFTIPELRGFESFCVGRPAEEMPGITSRICGVCPTAHHMASTRALDEVFGVEPPEGARLLRELIYMAFIIEDHLKNIELKKELDNNLPRIKVDPARMKQVFINIIKNAAEILQEKGRLKVKSEKSKARGKEVIQISFEDTGPGISKENLDQITFYIELIYCLRKHH